MIIGYTGLPRSGKSLSVISDYIIPFILKGRRVYTNIAGLDPMLLGHHLGLTSVETRKALYLFPAEMNMKGLQTVVEQLQKEKNSLLVLDECHEWLSPENWKELKFFRSFLSMCGHSGHDIILLSQSIEDIWEPLRNRVHETHIFVRGKLGFRTGYEEFVYRGSNIYLDFAFKNNRKDDKSIYGLYASTEKDANDKAVKYISIWQNRKLQFSILLTVFCFAFVGWRLSVDGVPLSNLSHKSDEPAKRISTSDNVIYVKYVACTETMCTGLRPDGTTINLPLDYDSGKYPFEVRRVPKNVSQNNNSIMPSARK